MDARRGAWKHNKGSIVTRWQENEKYRLDYFTTIDISYTAPLHQRHRHEHHHAGRQGDGVPNAGQQQAAADP